MKYKFSDWDEVKCFGADQYERNFIPIELPKTQPQKRNTKVTIEFDESFPSEYREYVVDLYNQVYPIIIAFSGEPYRNRTMKIYYRPDEHQTLSHDMKNLYMDRLPMNKDGNDPSFDAVFIVELYHQFIAGIELPVSRGYEYYSWAMSKLIAEYCNYHGIRSISAPSAVEMVSFQEGLDLYYERVILGEETFIGGDSVRVYNNFFIEQISSMFLKLLLSQSASLDNLDFFIKLNEKLYEYNDFFRAIADTSFNSIDGVPPLEWVKQQPYMDKNINSRFTFKMLPTRGGIYHGIFTLNTVRIYFFLFERVDNQRIPLNDGIIDISIFDCKGNMVSTTEIEINKSKYTQGFPTYSTIPELAEGKYQIISRIIVGNQILQDRVFIEIKK